MKIDSQAVRGFFQKNERCVEGVYYATSRLLKYVAFSILRNEGRAQEIVMETYLKAWRSPYSKDVSFVSWLCSIAKNLALDDLRKNPSCEELAEDRGSNSSYSTLWEELENLLSPLEFNVLIERAYFELSFKEIASLNQLPSSSSARGIYKRAREKSKASLKEYRP